MSPMPSSHAPHSSTTDITLGDGSGGRRKLPKTPANVSQAEVLMEFAIDPERQELAATLIAARGVIATPYAFVLVQVLPGGL